MSATAGASLRSSYADTSVPVAINYSDAKNYAGDSVSVKGTIVDVYTTSSGQVFFDYCKNYKSCPFSAVIFATDANNFGDVSRYEGKTIIVTGQIKIYNGTPEIVIGSPSQITE